MNLHQSKYVNCGTKNHTIFLWKNNHPVRTNRRNMNSLCMIRYVCQDIWVWSDVHYRIKKMTYNLACTAEIGRMVESPISNSSKSGSIIHFYAILIQMIRCSLNFIPQINKFHTIGYFTAVIIQEVDYVLSYNRFICCNSFSFKSVFSQAWSKSFPQWSCYQISNYDLGNSK